MACMTNAVERPFGLPRRGPGRRSAQNAGKDAGMAGGDARSTGLWTRCSARKKMVTGRGFSRTASRRKVAGTQPKGRGKDPFKPAARPRTHQSFATPARLKPCPVTDPECQSGGLASASAHASRRTGAGGRSAKSPGQWMVTPASPVALPPTALASWSSELDIISS